MLLSDLRKHYVFMSVEKNYFLSKNVGLFQPKTAQVKIVQ